jgi:hypothetical protein
MDALQKENVGVLTDEFLYLGVVPEADIRGLTNQLDQGHSPEEILGPASWSVEVRQITRLEVTPDSSSMEVRSNTRKNKDVFFPDKKTTMDVMEKVRALLGPGCQMSKRLDSTVAAGVIFVLFALLVLGVTGLLYWGVSAGWITRGPAFLAALVTFFGPTGILVTGGLLALIVLAASVRHFIKKSEVWVILRKP